jgi:hypothetical protein
MMDNNKKIPVGVFTLGMGLLALVLYLWPKPNCAILEEDLSSGYFIRWQSPQLLIVLANKQQLNFKADSKQQACGIALESSHLKKHIEQG